MSIKIKTIKISYLSRYQSKRAYRFLKLLFDSKIKKYLCRQLDSDCSLKKPRKLAHRSTKTSNGDNKLIKQAFKKDAPNSKDYNFLNQMDQCSNKKSKLKLNSRERY